MTRLVIHCEPRIPWQAKRAAYFVQGFRAKGIACEVTESRVRTDDCPAVLLGTSCWRGIEKDGGEFLLVDRCSFGDTEKFVSLVWNGHGRRGDHRVPLNYNGERWERYGQALKVWSYDMGKESLTDIVLCGQTETYSPHWTSIVDWYRSVPFCAFRPHPAGDNPLGIREKRHFDDGDCAVTLNSSIGVHCVLNGIPTVTMDEGSMAWDVTSHDPTRYDMTEREPWCHWLAWTQWSDDEIREGIPWDWHL